MFLASRAWQGQGVEVKTSRLREECLGGGLCGEEALLLRAGEGMVGRSLGTCRWWGKQSPVPGWPLLEGLVEGPLDRSLSSH